MEDGRHRSEYYGVQLRISHAACRFNGYIVTGVRHFCPIMRNQIDAMGGFELLNEWQRESGELETGDDQGFVDQYGRYLTREEAYIIAKEAGQIIREDHLPGTLFSECYI